MVENIKEVFIEKQVYLEDLNVRGFADLIITTNDDKVYLYDIKTINDWAYKMKFSAKYKDKGEASIHQELQLATYGIFIERVYGKVDGMFILYYNKNTSTMKQIEVSNDRISDAISFWKETIDNHKDGLPSLEKGVSPVMEWECRYCEYLTKCNEDKKRSNK
tara:strand:- start:3198 stop:3683 length:486 start_codon:yes stop_codon:yes gene_type:complete